MWILVWICGKRGGWLMGGYMYVYTSRTLDMIDQSRYRSGGLCFEIKENECIILTHMVGYMYIK